MYQLSADELKILIEALDMALASNKRMQNAKPKFHAVFAAIEAELTTLKTKLSSAPKK